MKKLYILFLSLFLLYWVGCKDENATEPPANNNDIPADPSNVTVPATTINNILPTATFTSTSGNTSRIKMNLTGLINPVTNQPIQLTALTNLFVTEDAKVKGLKVTKVSQGNVLAADVVFTVDNSGSMNQEADSVAQSIIKFSQALQASGLNVRFACVGYDVSGQISGAISFTNAQAIKVYLDRYTGTDRTTGFSGTDSAALANRANNFSNDLYDENGIAAVLFADSVFSWRSDAQRVFINFTDESTQPNNVERWGTNNFCSLMNGKATVHTVWSGYADTANAYTWQTLVDERPWDMSKCTGGTVVLIPDNATGLDLSTLPVTGALSNSYLVEFITSNPNAPHTVEIIIKESDADGKQVYQNITY